MSRKCRRFKKTVAWFRSDQVLPKKIGAVFFLQLGPTTKVNRSWLNSWQGIDWLELQMNRWLDWRPLQSFFGKSRQRSFVRSHETLDRWWSKENERIKTGLWSCSSFFCSGLSKLFGGAAAACYATSSKQANPFLRCPVVEEFWSHKHLLLLCCCCSGIRNLLLFGDFKLTVADVFVVGVAVLLSNVLCVTVAPVVMLTQMGCCWCLCCCYRTTNGQLLMLSMLVQSNRLE